MVSKIVVLDGILTPLLHSNISTTIWNTHTLRCVWCIAQFPISGIRSAAVMYCTLHITYCKMLNIIVLQLNKTVRCSLVSNFYLDRVTCVSVYNVGA
jgi:hypothetical protein